MFNPNILGISASGSQDPLVVDTTYTFEGIELELSRQLASLEETVVEMMTEVQDHLRDHEYREPLATNDRTLAILQTEVYGEDNVSLEGISDRLRKFVEGIATTLNKVAMTIDKLLMTGLPLFKACIQKASKLRAIAKDVQTKKRSDSIKLEGKMAYYLSVDGVISPEKLAEQSGLISEIAGTLLSRNKLSQFTDMSSRVLEPYRGTVKSSKTDEVVFVLGILAAITNPTVPVGVLLKQLFGAVSPGMGKKVDMVTTAAGLAIGGGVISGLTQIIPTMGNLGASYVRDWANGRMDISAIPKYADVYTFCGKSVDDKRVIFIKHQSDILLGNRYFEVTDYRDELTREMRAVFGKTGAEFKKHKTDKEPDSRVEALDLADVVTICDNIIAIFTHATNYAKSFRQHYKAYNTQYRQISDIVMSYDDDRLRGTYVRYSYRNAMNLILGSMWQNCFGSDNKFIRHNLSVAKHLLRYCEQSLIVETIDVSE